MLEVVGVQSDTQNKLPSCSITTFVAKLNALHKFIQNKVGALNQNSLSTLVGGGDMYIPQDMI